MACAPRSNEIALVATESTRKRCCLGRLEPRWREALPRRQGPGREHTLRPKRAWGRNMRHMEPTAAASKTSERSRPFGKRRRSLQQGDYGVKAAVPRQIQGRLAQIILQLTVGAHGKQLLHLKIDDLEALARPAAVCRKPLWAAACSGVL